MISFLEYDDFKSWQLQNTENWVNSHQAYSQYFVKRQQQSLQIILLFIKKVNISPPTNNFFSTFIIPKKKKRKLNYNSTFKLNKSAQICPILLLKKLHHRNTNLEETSPSILETNEISKPKPKPNSFLNSLRHSIPNG